LTSRSEKLKAITLETDRLQGQRYEVLRPETKFAAELGLRRGLVSAFCYFTCLCCHLEPKELDESLCEAIKLETERLQWQRFDVLRTETKFAAELRLRRGLVFAFC
jgi:hypothetical protein